MALTLEVEQRLIEVGLVGFYEKDKAAIWIGLAKEAYGDTRKTYPDGSIIRHDDVARPLPPF